MSLLCWHRGAASAADAQVCRRPYTPRPGYPAARVYVASPHHASTATESFARGYADLVRSWGHYNLFSSEAMVNLAEARRRETENRVARTEAYFQMREINRRHRHGDRATDSRRYSVTSRNRVTPIRTESKPEPVDLREGLAAWPKALQNDAFQSYRKAVEQIANKQPTLGATSETDRLKVTQASRAMALELRDRIREYSPQDYLAAKRFLTALCLDRRAAG